MKHEAPTTRGKESRRRLQDAALRVFVARGIDAATTKEIAREAGMAEGNLYRHYASKEDLAWAVYEAQLARVVGELESVVEDTDARTNLKSLLHRFRSLFEAEPDVYSFIVIAQHNLLSRTPKTLRTPVDVVGDVLARGQRRREVRKGDLQLLPTYVIGMVVRVTLLKLHGFFEQSIDELEHDTLEACWRVVRKEEKA
jgi:AcrR family transcriptional regulator